ncbi:MAG: hypothetical protein AB7K24_32705 [Gemmataceae bacterium]
MSERQSWIVAMFDDAKKINETLPDLHQEGFQQIGIIVSEAAARVTPAAPVIVDGILLEHVIDSAGGRVLVGGLGELNPDHLTPGDGLAARLDEIGIGHTEIGACIEAIENGQAIVLVRADDRYSEGLAILNTHGARDTIREAQR